MNSNPSTLQTATFAAGCFWGVEETFRQVPGVKSTQVGYTGGTADGPTYKQVCSGRTGHAEAVQIEFDPSEVTYERLLEVFWDCHNPTTRNRQGWDIGSQYRSAIFFHTPEQEAVARKSKEARQGKGFFARKIVTEITPAGPFYRAEEYHQQYIAKRHAPAGRLA
jgi:peptide-methionine (S)-S-oxide reductase